MAPIAAGGADSGSGSGSALFQNDAPPAFFAAAVFALIGRPVRNRPRQAAVAFPALPIASSVAFCWAVRLGSFGIWLISQPIPPSASSTPSGVRWVTLPIHSMTLQIAPAMALPVPLPAGAGVPVAGPDGCAEGDT
ncbi:hypothetical protein F7Q99_39915 [Streptomyces kaniharaensis]|uniref:Uncharacterized protein n=1 Tax=Streptomyces kaniharaensis TaxID=212423 RepID=A0A6N7L5C6_9ACTN|nr:hypothetical protein [Streptomyces kaniharaensis]MQS18189.1 hypothetical protein [Streptomyces kaniharaensis]